MRKKGDKDKFKNKRVHFKDDYDLKRTLNQTSQLITSHSTRNLSSSLSLERTQNQKSPLKVKITTENVGKISTASTQQKTTINDFEISTKLGSGSYAKVVLAKHKLNGKIYSIKIINKSTLDKEEKQHEVHIEKYFLATLKHPCILKLHKTFQDSKHLYFVIDFCKNSDLGKLLYNVKTLDYDLAKFYASEILSVLNFMHKDGIYHRDLKPENIGLDNDMHLKLFDFATANYTNKYFDRKTMRFVDIKDPEILNELKTKIKNVTSEEQALIKIDKYNILLLSHLLVGTPEYVAPEVLEHNYDVIGPSVDIWAFGVILFLFFVGKTPFKGKNENETLDNIKNIKYSFEGVEKNIPDDVKKIIKKIFVKDPNKRPNSKQLMEEDFFKGIDFSMIDCENVPLDKMKNVLNNLGYSVSSDRNISSNKNIMGNNIQNDFGEDNKTISGSDDEIEKGGHVKRNSLNNFDQIKNDLKGIPMEHDVLFDNDVEKSEENNVVMEGILLKKSPWLHYNTRYVKLYSKGYIDYFDPDQKTLRGSFFLNDDCKATMIDQIRFEIVTTNRNFIFKSKIKNSADWVDKINELVAIFKKKNKGKKKVDVMEVEY